MNTKRMALLREFRIKKKYEILLVSFILLVFGDIFFPEDLDVMPYLILQNVLASTYLFYGRKPWRIPLFSLLIILVALVLINRFTGFANTRILFSIIYVIYFVFLSVEVYRQIMVAKEIDFGTIAAVLCGFIILGLIGGSMFAIVEILQPHSFNNLPQGFRSFSDLIYFSYITILSVGYGDITPATEIAKKLTVLLGLAGYFYGVVVIGIIIGKYISKRS